MTTTTPKFTCGSIWKHDFRSQPVATRINGNVFRVVSFNIERGYELQDIIKYLRDIDADIVLLQEVDFGCIRTGRLNIAGEIANALSMNVCWACEFEELDSPFRTPRLAGDGYHGNAIITKFDIKNCYAVPHQIVPFDWSSGWRQRLLKQPRKGGRVILYADIALKDQCIVRFYSLHLENMCGALQRLEQMGEVMAMINPHEIVVLGGDLNTLMHGIVRWIPIYPGDSLRFRTLGKSESEYWDSNFLNHSTLPPNAHTDEKDLMKRIPDLSRLSQFTDAFEKGSKGATFENSPFYCSKLDWLLHDPAKLECIGKSMGPPGLSDHLAIVNDYRFKKDIQ